MFVKGQRVRCIQPKSNISRDFDIDPNTIYIVDSTYGEPEMVKLKGVYGGRRGLLSVYANRFIPAEPPTDEQYNDVV